MFYRSYSSFYFLNLPVLDQIKHFDEYYELRSKLNVEKNEVVEALYKTFDEHRDEFWNMIDMIKRQWY